MIALVFWLDLVMGCIDGKRDFDIDSQRPPLTNDHIMDERRGL